MAKSENPGRRTSTIRPSFFLGLLLVLAILLALNVYEASLGDEAYSDRRLTNLREMIYVTALALDAEP